MAELIKVFVYGTLMNNGWNHSYLNGQKFLGKAKLDNFEMYNVASFPGIVRKENEYVLGEIYEVDHGTLKKLDRLEGEGSMYKRSLEKVLINDRVEDAYVYVWLGSVQGRDKVATINMPWQFEKMRWAR